MTADAPSPNEFILVPRRPLQGLMTMGLSLFIGAVPLIMVTEGPTGGVPGVAIAAMLLIPAIALVVFLGGLRMAIGLQTARITDTAVILTRVGLLGRRVDTLPRSDYLGLGTYVRRRRRGKNRRTEYIVNMVPREGTAARPVDLAGTPRESALRGLQESWARRLAMPVISVEDGGVVHLRPAEDLDRNIKERLARGQVAVDQATIAQAPAEGLVQETRDGAALALLRTTPEYPPSQAALTIGIPAAIAVVAFSQRSPWLGVIALGFVALFAYVTWRDRTTRLRLVIDDTAIRTERVNRAGEASVESSAPIESIEEILIQKKSLRFVSDSGGFDFGSFLPPATLAWARQRVLAAIAQMN